MEEQRNIFCRSGIPSEESNECAVETGLKKVKGQNAESNTNKVLLHYRPIITPKMNMRILLLVEKKRILLCTDHMFLRCHSFERFLGPTYAQIRML
jgi:hypothetical protein